MYSFRQLFYDRLLGGIPVIRVSVLNLAFGTLLAFAFLLESAGAAPVEVSPGVFIDGGNVKVSPDRFRKQLYAQLALNRSTGMDRYKGLTKDRLLREMYKAGAFKSTDEGLHFFSRFEEIWKEQINHPDVKSLEASERFARGVENIFNIISAEVPVLANLAQLNKVGNEFILDYYRAKEEPRNYAYQKGREAGLVGDLESKAIQVLGESFELAQKDTKFAEFYNAVFASERNARTDTPVTTLLNNNPEFMSYLATLETRGAIEGLPSVIKSIIRQQAADERAFIEFKLSEFAKLVEPALREIGADTTESRKQLETLIDEVGKQGDKQDGILIYMEKLRNQEANALKIQRQAEAAALKTRLIFGAHEAGLTIVTGLINLVDPVAARRVSTVGNAALTVGRAINEHAETLSQIGKVAEGVLEKGALTDMASMVLVGNIAGAAFSLLDVFLGVDTGPTTADVMRAIQTGVDDLKAQISELDKKLTTRFDELDEKLVVLFEATQQGFEAIDRKLNGLAVNLDQIAGQIGEVQHSIHGLSRELFERDTAGERRRYLNMAELVLGYPATHFGQELEQNLFEEGRAYFISQAIDFSRDPFATGPTNRFDNPNDFEAGRIAEELDGDFTVDQDLSYVSDALKMGFGGGFASTPIRNPTEWALGANAFAQLLRENPTPAKTLDPVKLDSVLEAGRGLTQAIESITVKKSNADGTNVVQRERFDTLTGNIVTRRQALYVRLKKLRDDWRAQNAPKVDIFQGIDQVIAAENRLPFDPQSDAIRDCHAGGAGLRVRPGLSGPEIIAMKSWLHTAYALSLLGAGKLCYDTDWVEKREEEVDPGSRETWLFGKAHLIVKLTTTGRATPLWSFEWTSEEVAIRNALSSDNVVVREWNRSVGNQAAAAIAAGQGFSEGLGKLALETATKLQTLQKLLFGTYLNALNDSAATANTLHRELLGAHRLLRRVIEMGMARRLASDDGLRTLLFGDQRLLDDGAEGKEGQRMSMHLESKSEDFQAADPLDSLEARSIRIEQFIFSNINAYLDQIAAGTWKEGLPNIDDMLSILRATDREVYDVAVAVLGMPKIGVSHATRDLALEIVASRGVKAVTCTLDGASLPCGIGPLKLTGLANGSHRLVMSASGLRSDRKAETMATFNVEVP